MGDTSENTLLTGCCVIGASSAGWKQNKGGETGRADSAEESVALPESICAIGCAYAVLKLEGHADLTTRELIEDLGPLANGRVPAEALAEVLRARGLAVNSMKGLSVKSLRQADAREGLYVMLLTGTSIGPPAQSLDHVMLYRRTDENGNCIVVNPPGIVTYSAEQLREQWAGGYALLTARTPAILDAFIDTVRLSVWDRLRAAAGVAFVVAIGAGLAWRRLKRRHASGSCLDG